MPSPLRWSVPQAAADGSFVSVREQPKESILQRKHKAVAVFADGRVRHIGNLDVPGAAEAVAACLTAARKHAGAVARMLSGNGTTRTDDPPAVPG